MPEPGAEVPENNRQSRVRKDLLSWEEAKEECCRRLANVLPDLPALGIVIIMGAVGAALATWWHLNIGEKEFASGISKLPLFLRMCLGSVGATAAVFFLARTDTSKLIHCSLIAVLSGMAGPYLITKALDSVVGVSPNLVTTDAQIMVVEKKTETLGAVYEKQSSAKSNPEELIEVYKQTAQATTNLLDVVERAPKNEKQQALVDTKPQLQKTLKLLDTAAKVDPKQSLSLLRQVAAQATKAGATDIAEETQQIIKTNPALSAAAEVAKKSGKVYVIAPEEVTDPLLHDLYVRIKAKYPFADIQSVVHPTRLMENGLEVVYYRDEPPSDRQTASDLETLVADYLREQEITFKRSPVTKGHDDRPVPPFNFDIHLGPEIASGLLRNPSAPTAPAPQSATPIKKKRSRH